MAAILPSSCCGQGGGPVLILGWGWAAFELRFPCLLNHPKAQRAGETVAWGDHSWGEAASKLEEARGDPTPVGRVAGCSGPRRPAICLSQLLNPPATKELRDSSPAVSSQHLLQGQKAQKRGDMDGFEGQ